MTGTGRNDLEPSQHASRDAIPLASYYEHERHRREVIRNVAVFVTFCLAVAALGVGLIINWQQG